MTDMIKTIGELKAEPFSTSQLDRWLKGEISRRILMLPFYGPLPGGREGKGRDMDAEYFDDATDIYGPYPALKASRKRVVDFHHDQDPIANIMKGAFLGHIEIDEAAETVKVDGIDYTGRWADFWTNAGEKRRALVAMLERKGVPFFASTQAVKGARELWPPDPDGHINTWPITRLTVTTSPQNTHAVMPALKAMLAAPSLDEIPADALKALLVGLDADTQELLLSSSETAVDASVRAGEEAVKAGRVLSKKNMTDLQAAIGLLSDLLSRGVLLPPVEETGALEQIE